ncbi:MAG: WD40 repeat domain-containing protein, partial [Candidatus Poseidoniaceae archaeon]
MRSRICITTVVVFVLIFTMPLASSTSSGINFLDATVSDKADAHTNSVSINENQTIIASSYSTFIEFHNSSSLELIKRFDFGRELYHIEFSPDGKYLAASMSANEAIPDSLRVIDVENLDLLSAQAKGNNRPGNLDYSPDGAKIIAPNMNNGAQILNSITMNEIATLNGEHTSDVTCTGFSKTGNYVITGDESGKVKVWNADGELTNIDIDVEEEIV